MAVTGENDMQRKASLKTQLTFVCDGVDEKVVVAAMRDYLEEYGWVMVTEQRFKNLNKVHNQYRSLCEQVGGTMPAMLDELRGFKGQLENRLKAVERLSTIALEPIFSQNSED